MTNKWIFLSLVMLLLSHLAFSQVYLTRNGTIRFFSEAPLENIEAVNRQVMSALNTETGEFVFRLPMRSFTFDKALMQEHFNDNFVESHTYPNSSFQGFILDLKKIDFDSGGEFDVLVEGKLTIKDVTKKVRESGTLTIKKGEVAGSTVFIIRPEDYNIRIPGRYVRNIASDIEVYVDVILHPQ